MTKLTQFALLSALSFSAASAQARIPDPESERAAERRLLVWVTDHVGVAPSELDTAIEDAKLVLAEAGIQTDWIVCSRPSQVGEMPKACRAASGPWILRVRLLSNEAAKTFPLDDTNFGMAYPGEGDRLGSAADVFPERCRLHAEKMRVAETLVLGRVLAHEIGHLLLGESSHSVSGIMSARWKRKQLNAAEQGGFGFVGRQAKTMQKQAARRLALLD